MRGLQCGTKLAFYGIAVEADASNNKGGPNQPVSVIGDCSLSLPVASRHPADGLLDYP